MQRIGMPGSSNGCPRPDVSAAVTQPRENFGASIMNATNPVEIQEKAKGMLNTVFYFDVLKYSVGYEHAFVENHSLTKGELDYLCKLKSGPVRPKPRNINFTYIGRTSSNPRTDFATISHQDGLSETDNYFETDLTSQSTDTTAVTERQLEAHVIQSHGSHLALEHFPLPTTEPAEQSASYRKDSGIVMESDFAEEMGRKSPLASASFHQAHFQAGADGEGHAGDGAMPIEDPQTTQPAVCEIPGTEAAPLTNKNGFLTADGVVHHFGPAADTRFVYSYAYHLGHNEGWTDGLIHGSPCMSCPEAAQFDINVAETAVSSGVPHSQLKQENQYLSIPYHAPATTSFGVSQNQSNAGMGPANSQMYVPSSEEVSFVTNDPGAAHCGLYDFNTIVPRESDTENDATTATPGHILNRPTPFVPSGSASIAPLRTMDYGVSASATSSLEAASVAPLHMIDHGGTVSGLLEGDTVIKPYLPSHSKPADHPKSDSNVFKNPRPRCASSRCAHIAPRVPSLEAEGTIVVEAPRSGEKRNTKEAVTNRGQEFAGVSAESSRLIDNTATESAEKLAKTRRRRVVAGKTPRLSTSNADRVFTTMPELDAVDSEILQTVAFRPSIDKARAEGASEPQSCLDRAEYTTKDEANLSGQPLPEPASPLTPRKRRALNEMEGHRPSINSGHTTPTKEAKTASKSGHVISVPYDDSIKVPVPKLSAPPRKKVKMAAARNDDNHLCAPGRLVRRSKRNS